MEYEQLSLTLEDYQRSKEDIKNNLSGIVKSFVRVGWHLARIDASRAYKMDGYKTIAEFAKGEYDMTPTGVSQFIKVYNNYSLPGDTPELKEQYRAFNFSQLREMLQIPEGDHEMILPEAKRESIREMRRFNTENENNPDNLMDWKEEKKEDPIRITITEFFRENGELMNEIFSSKAWEQQNINGMVDIINPSGNKSYRKGRIFLMMYGPEQGLIINEFAKGKTKMTWPEFIQIIMEIFGSAIDGSRTYQNYFGGTQDESGRNSEIAETGSGREGTKTEGRADEDLRGERKKTSAPAETRREPGSGTNDCTPAPERTAAGKKSENNVSQRIEPATETTKTRDEPRPEKESEPEKSEIAPAQQDLDDKDNDSNYVYMGKCSLTDIIKGIPDPTSEEIEAAENEMCKARMTAPETVEGEVIETLEEKVPFGSRWEFLKMQGTFSIALTLAAVISETEYGRLQMADFWDSWLKEEVDEEGETFEPQTEKEA